MRYTLLLYYPELAEEELGEEALEQGRAAFQSFANALEEAGVLVSAEVLQPTATATRLSRRAGKSLIHDGPFIETKEQLGGTFVLDVPDLDVALGWAEKCPAAEWGTIEIRPSAVRFVGGSWIPAN